MPKNDLDRMKSDGEAGAGAHSSQEMDNGPSIMTVIQKLYPSKYRPPITGVFAVVISFEVCKYQITIVWTMEMPRAIE